MFLAACGHTAPPAPERAPSRSTAVGTPAARVDPTAAARGSDKCELPPVYFQYDSALIDDRSREALLATIGCYNHSASPQSLRLQGATDPRGTEEYNLALGMRRAEAVRRVLVTLGIAEGRISATSVGEEVAAGQDEAGWRLDRRVVAADP